MSNNTTTISVKESTKEALWYEKQPGDSYDAALRRVLGIENS